MNVVAAGIRLFVLVLLDAHEAKGGEAKGHFIGVQDRLVRGGAAAKAMRRILAIPLDIVIEGAAAAAASAIVIDKGRPARDLAAQ